MIDYKDIKQIPTANYRVDVALDCLEIMTRRYVKDHGAILNPDFQRGHVWTMEQKSKFIEFLMCPCILENDMST